MSKQKESQITVTRYGDSRRTATESFLNLILNEVENPIPTVEKPTVTRYNKDSVTQAASQEVQ